MAGPGKARRADGAQARLVAVGDRLGHRVGGEGCDGEGRLALSVTGPDARIERANSKPKISWGDGCRSDEDATNAVDRERTAALLDMFGGQLV